jgi:Lipocalin-like domain
MPTRVMTLAFVITLSLASSRILAQNRSPVIGTWKLTSYELEFQDTGERRPGLGANPTGYVIFTPEGRIMVYMQAAGRKGVSTEAERAAAFQTLIAYTGKYRVEGDNWITNVDGAWIPEWVGGEQRRVFTINGDHLTVLAQWNANPTYSERMTRGRLTFQRER